MPKYQRVEVPFHGGLDQKTKPEALPTGSFSVLQNVVQTRDGAYGKRNGFTTLPRTIYNTGGGVHGGNLGAGKAIFSCKDIPAVVDTFGGADYVYGYSAQQQAWHEAGAVSGCGVSVIPMTPTYPITATTGPVFAGDFIDTAYCNGYYITAVSGLAQAGIPVGAGASVSIVDAATGLNVLTDCFIWSGVASNHALCKIACLGNVVYFFYWDSNLAANMKWASIDVSSAASIAAAISTIGGLPSLTLSFVTNITNLKIGASNVPMFDVTAGSSLLYVAYVDANVGIGVTVRSYNNGMVQQTTSGGLGAPNAASVGIGGDQTDRIWVAWDNDGGARVCAVVGLNPANLAASLSTKQTVITMDLGESGQGISVVSTGSGTGHLMVMGLGLGQIYWRNFNTVASAVNPVGNQFSTGWWQPLTRQIYMNGRVYAHWMHADTGAATDQRNAVIVDITGTGNGTRYESIIPRLVASVEPGLAVHMLNLAPGYGFAHWAIQSGTNIACPQPVYRSSLAGAVAINLYRLDFNDPTRFQAVTLGEHYALSGGAPYAYDGTLVHEVGFAQVPQIVSVTLNPVAGSLTIGASYHYKVLFEFLDSAGCVTWSASSQPVLLTPNPSAPAGAGTGQQATIVCQCLEITSKIAQVTSVVAAQAVLYRQLGQGVFNRVISAPMDPRGNHSVTLIDANADAVVLAQPPLYTDEGGQPRFKPPPLRSLIAHGDRLVGVDPTGKNVWFSGQYIYGESPWWTNSFQFPIDAGGSIVALGSMDGRLYAFKRDRIFFVDGDGPPDAGGPGFSLPQEFPAGVGCIEPRSVVQSPIGLFFQSDRGIYLVDRSNTLQFIGRGVEQSTLGATIVSATCDVTHGRIYFGIGDAAISRLVYDYVHNVWTTDQITVPGGGGPHILTGEAIIGGNTSATAPLMYLQDSSGQVYQETPSAYLDIGVWITATAAFSFRTDGNQSYSRVKKFSLLAESVTPHQSTTTVSYDYSGSVTDSVHFSDAELVALQSTREQIGFDFSRQKFEQVTISMSDAAPATLGVGTGYGANWIGYAFEVAMRDGIFRLPAANTK